jgi:hypothetical protein
MSAETDTPPRPALRGLVLVVTADLFGNYERRGLESGRFKVYADRAH